MYKFFNRGTCCVEIHVHILYIMRRRSVCTRGRSVELAEKRNTENFIRRSTIYACDYVYSVYEMACDLEKNLGVCIMRKINNKFQLFIFVPTLQVSYPADIRWLMYKTLIHGVYTSTTISVYRIAGTFTGIERDKTVCIGTYNCVVQYAKMQNPECTMQQNRRNEWKGRGEVMNKLKLDLTYSMFLNAIYFNPQLVVASTDQQLRFSIANVALLVTPGYIVRSAVRWRRREQKHDTYSTRVGHWIQPEEDSKHSLLCIESFKNQTEIFYYDSYLSLLLVPDTSGAEVTHWHNSPCWLIPVSNRFPVNIKWNTSCVIITKNFWPFHSWSYEYNTTVGRRYV